jgi:hypothetical protein
VFDFIHDNTALLAQLDHKAALLMAIDEGRALNLLVTHHDICPPGALVPGLIMAMEEAEREGDQGGKEVWRRRLHTYLHRLFLVRGVGAG